MEVQKTLYAFAKALKGFKGCNLPAIMLARDAYGLVLPMMFKIFEDFVKAVKSDGLRTMKHHGSKMQ